MLKKKHADVGAVIIIIINQRFLMRHAPPNVNNITKAHAVCCSLLHHWTKQSLNVPWMSSKIIQCHADDMVENSKKLAQRYKSLWPLLFLFWSMVQLTVPQKQISPPQGSALSNLTEHSHQNICVNFREKTVNSRGQELGGRRICQ